MKTTSRILVCVLGAIFIFSSLGAVYAVDPSPSPTPGYELDDGHAVVDEALMSYYIWLCMRAWGIQISYKDSLEWQQSVSDMIVTWVIEYLEDLPSSYSINQWIAPWQSSFDYWGNYQFNNSALEDIQDFVDWLMSKLGITDNSTIVISPEYVFGGYSIFESNIYYSAGFTSGEPSDWIALKVTENQNDSPILFSQITITDEFREGYEKTFPVLVSKTQPNSPLSVSFKAYDANNTQKYSGTAGVMPNGWQTNGIIYYYNLENSYAFYSNLGYFAIKGGTNFKGTRVLYNTFLSTADIVTVGDTKVLSNDILLPINNPDYTDGDSIVIVGDDAQYIEIEWSGEVTVSNLPAIVSTGSIPVPGDELNPGLVNAWHPISTLIEMTADSMGMLIGIVYEFPEEVLIPIYAVLGGIIIFGIIHAMKEH